MLSLLASVALSAPPSTVAQAVCDQRTPCTEVRQTPAGHGPDGHELVVVEVLLSDTPVDEAQQPAWGGPCEPFEHHLVRLHDGEVVDHRLLLELCNDGYGASGVGEDHIVIEPNRFSHDQNGGSSWRWSQGRTVQLVPDQELEVWSSTYISPMGNESRTRWGWTTLSGEVHTTLVACDDLESYDTAEDDLAVLLPIVPPWPDGGPGGCAATLDSSDTRGLVVHGEPGEPDDARMAVALVGDQLQVRVDDDTLTTADRWIHGDHLELWLPDGPRTDSGRCTEPWPARQWGIDLDGVVHAGHGTPSVRDLSATATRDEHGTTWAIDLPPGSDRLTVVYSDSDDGASQERLLATSTLRAGDAHSLGSVRDLRPSGVCTPEGIEALREAIVPQAPPPAEGWVLHHPRLLDASGPRQVEALVVRGDRIAHIGAARPEDADLPSLDATGLTIVPGLIDAHVHLSMAPGGAFVDRTPEQIAERRAHHLRAYVASGVVAVLDTGILPADADALLALAEHTPSPHIAWLGPLVSPPGGYLSAVLPDFAPTPDAATLQQQLEGFDRFDPIGVKVTMEDGMLRAIWPWQRDEVLDALAAQDRPLFVHAMEPEEYRLALDRLPVAAFVHPLDHPDDELLARLQGIPVVTTLAVMDTLLLTTDPTLLDDPLLQRVVPADELAAAADRTTIKASYRAVADAILPRSPGFVKGLAASAMSSRGPLRGRVRKLGAAVRELHEGGVTLVMGSDSGNWPVFLTEFHGATSVREVELLVEAGIPALDALRMATLNGANLLGLGDELGTLEVGKQASFLAVEADPLSDLSVLRNPAWVVLRGERRTPEGWLDTAAGTTR